jgi:phosphate-selective porin OprO/OprP
MGRFKQPFGLEQLTSSNNIDFMERSYADQLAPGKKLGVMLHGEPIGGFTYAISHFQQDSRQQSEGDGFQSAARLTLNASQLFKLQNSVLHLGVAGTDGHYQVRPATSSQTSSAASTTTRATIVGFNSENRGLSNIYRAQISGSTLATAGFGTSDEIAANISKEMTGMEVALAFGPVKFQGEMVTASYDATHQSAGQTVIGDVDADYVELIWNVTGEKWSDAYRSGIFSGIKPNNNFKPGSGPGAWQIAARFSSYDASDIPSAERVRENRM